MTKDIKNLQKDIYHVLNTGEGYTKEIADWVGEQISLSTQRQLIDKRTGKSYLRMSNMGTPCERKLWYSVQNFSDSMKEQLQPYVKNKFIYGDVIECWALGLVKAAGYKLEGMQDVMEINGVKGSRDCVIEGTTFDVKSASTFGMDKFKDNGLLKDDPFAYLSQLSSYVYAAKDDPIVTDKKHGAFLVFEKQHGHVLVDTYDLTPWLEEKEAEVLRKKSIVASKKEPPRGFEDVPDGASGNRKLGNYCSYCDYKFQCYPDLSKYIYSNGPRYLSVVEREPKVFKET